MKRRTFIVKAGALFSLPLIITEIGCSDDEPENGTNPTGSAVESFSITSSVNDDHSHTLTIQIINVDNPPAEGNTISSTENSNHTHTIMLTQKNFQQLAAGETLTVLSSSASGNYSPHSHSFSIKVP